LPTGNGQHGRAGKTAAQPGWLKMITNMSAIQAFGLGIMSMTVNTKNIPILSSLGLTIARADLTGVALWTTFVVIALIGVSALIGLGLAPVLFGARGDRALIEVNDFMIGYTNVIMLVIFLLLGANFIGNGITALSA